jgi:hypothetical protein
VTTDIVIPGPRKSGSINNIVVVSDIHAGCKLAICPPEGVDLDDGGRYMPSALQLKIYEYWREFWDEFVPVATRGEPFGTVINGDAVEGTHHRATTPISHNMGDQVKVAIALLKPVMERSTEGVWAVRGTEAHVGISAQTEEGMFAGLGVIPNSDGQYARWDLWKYIGDEKLIHFLHHIGTTGSQAYEATAVHKELVEEFAEAARWGERPPDVIVRSHRHRHYEEAIATRNNGRAYAVVTPSWQAKTPFAWKIPGARISTPQFGGVVIRYSDDGELFIRSYVQSIARSAAE